MANKMCVTLTSNNIDRANIAFALAHTAACSSQEVAVVLVFDAVHLSQVHYSDDFSVPEFQPLTNTLRDYAEAGGKIFVCAPCFNRRCLKESNLVLGATIVGAAQIVEFLSGGTACMSF